MLACYGSEQLELILANTVFEKQTDNAQLKKLHAQPVPPGDGVLFHQIKGLQGGDQSENRAFMQVHNAADLRQGQIPPALEALQNTNRPFHRLNGCFFFGLLPFFFHEYASNPFIRLIIQYPVSYCKRDCLFCGFFHIFSESGFPGGRGNSYYEVSASSASLCSAPPPHRGRLDRLSRNHVIARQCAHCRGPPRGFPSGTIPRIFKHFRF